MRKGFPMLVHILDGACIDFARRGVITAGASLAAGGGSSELWRHVRYPFAGSELLLATGSQGGARSVADPMSLLAWHAA